MKLKLPSKKHMLYTGIIATIVIFCTAMLLNIISTQKLLNEINQSKISASMATYAQSIDSLSSEATYRLYECGGKIGIYDAKTEILIDIIDVFVSTLPQNDKLALESGIDIFDFSELVKIINDFTT